MPSPSRLIHCCEGMKNGVEEEAVRYLGKYREWGVEIPDGGSSVLILTYCPWCAKKLPVSLRGEWHEKLLAMGYDIYAAKMPSIPSEYKSDRWWKNRSTSARKDSRR